MSGRLPPVAPALVGALETAASHVGSRATDRLAAAHDASHYLLTPLAVVTPRDSAEVSAVLATARAFHVSATFRSGGTSLSGQASSRGLLIDTRRHFRRIEVLDAGALVRTGPGATVRAVNARLLPHGRKLGPDPASEVACTVGGVIANNSSGMACGTHANAYVTLDSAVLVLPSGTIIDTGGVGADAELRRKEPVLHAGLLDIRDRLLSDHVAAAEVRRQFAIKNTMGYALNAFLDEHLPIRILQRLVVGSEGTLAFVADAVFRTVPIKPFQATALLLFQSLGAATDALRPLTSSGAETIELLDSSSLRVAQRNPDATRELSQLCVADHAALLVEYQESSASGLSAQLGFAEDVLAQLPLVGEATFSTDQDVRARLWRIRKGLYAAVAGSRPAGTTALLEDIAVPVDQLGEMVTELVRLFARHEYHDSVIFGHAKDGNIHFLLNERFDNPEGVARYERFTEEMVTAVLRRGGTLKAEHGTGRIMAPYMRRQYGSDLYEMMWEIKRLIDPQLLLNPGVLLTHDSHLNGADLKTSPPVEEEVDRCVECGYCEPVCPSRDLTLTPRQRIVLRRELERARDRGDSEVVAAIEAEYEYDGEQTCAVDGMCQTACPVLINTGDLVRRLRSQRQGPVAQGAWAATAHIWGATSSAGGAALTVAHALPAALVTGVTTAARAVFGAEAVPGYAADLPRGGHRRKPRSAENPVAVYFPSCTSTMFGGEGTSDVSQAFMKLCEGAGLRIATPEDIPSLCCGTPWKSKGLNQGYTVMRDKVAASLRRATDNGRLPVVCDASSCTEGLNVLLDAAAQEQIRVVDAVAFVDEHMLPMLPSLPKIPSITLHPTCSSARLGIDAALQRIARAVAERVVIPDDWQCCAFAGDRGMLHPELTASATRSEAHGVASLASAAHASLNRTCEIGMSRATGMDYQHILQVLADSATTRTSVPTST